MTRLWATRSGGRIHVEDMSDAHLRNALAMVHRHAERRLVAYLATLPADQEDGWGPMVDSLARMSPTELLLWQVGPDQNAIRWILAEWHARGLPVDAWAARPRTGALAVPEAWEGLTSS